MENPISSTNDHDLRNFIERGVFSKSSLSSSVVCLSRIALVSEVSEVFLSVVDDYVRSPLRVPLEPADTLVRRCANDMLPAVLLILLWRAYSEISATVIKGIAVHVVGMHTRRGLHQVSVKKKLLAPPYVSTDIPSASTIKPLSTFEQWKIGFVNQGGISISQSVLHSPLIITNGQQI